MTAAMSLFRGLFPGLSIPMLSGGPMSDCFSRCRREEGSVIILVVLVLAILTIIGLSATNTADIELSIAGNDKLYRMAFSSAEGGSFATAKLVSHIIDTSDVPPPAPAGGDGLKYNDPTVSELYDEVMGLKDADDKIWDPAPDVNFSLGGVEAPVAPPPGERPVSLPKAEVEIDLKRLGQIAAAGESAEFGTGAEGLGAKTIVVIPYAFASEGDINSMAKARIRNVYYKYKDKPGGI